MMEHDDKDRDPMLAGALREAMGGTRLDEAAEDALARRIVAASAFRLAVLRRARPFTWWEQTARWSRVAGPIGAAAAAAGIALAMLAPTEASADEAPLPLAEAVVSAIPGHDALGALASDTIWTVAGTAGVSR